MTVGDLLSMLEDVVEFDPVFGNYDMICRYKGRTMYVTDIVVRTFKNSFVCLNCDPECDDEKKRLTINNAIVKLKNHLSKKSINNETEIIGCYNLEMMKIRPYDISLWAVI